MISHLKNRGHKLSLMLSGYQIKLLPLYNFDLMPTVEIKPNPYLCTLPRDFYAQREISTRHKRATDPIPFFSNNAVSPQKTTAIDLFAQIKKSGKQDSCQTIYLQIIHNKHIIQNGTFFRAVLMTAWSFIFGVLSLLFASGAGAESRKVIGTTTFWGMLTATILGVAFIPPLYTMFQKAREKAKNKH